MNQLDIFKFCAAFAIIIPGSQNEINKTLNGINKPLYVVEIRDVLPNKEVTKQVINDNEHFARVNFFKDLLLLNYKAQQTKYITT
jgi:hypothetical protein